LFITISDKAICSFVKPPYADSGTSFVGCYGKVVYLAGQMRLPRVMAGLVPAIHDFIELKIVFKSWMPATRAGMTQADTDMLPHGKRVFKKSRLTQRLQSPWQNQKR
jgi:hypothetical protein